MNNGSRPPSPRRFHRLAQEIQKGEIIDYDLLYLCESNPFYQTQLDALLRAPAEAVENAKQQQEQARIDALRRLRLTLRRTCYRRRDHIYLQHQLHHNGSYLKLLRRRRNDREKQARWNRFVMDLKMFRITQAHSWIDRRHSQWMSNVIFNSDPFELATAWPEGSCCPIDPQMSPDWVLLKPPIQPTIISVERTATDMKRIRTEAENLFYMWKAQFTRQTDITTTTTNEQGTRTSYSPDTGDTINIEGSDASQGG
jgi:hypothetical protein